MMYSTLAEIKRTCKYLASTNNPDEYYKAKGDAIYEAGQLEFVQEWESIAIYSNKIYYLVVYHNKNLNEIYKTYSK